MSYLPWWAGALTLGTIAVGYARLSGRALGVSGSMARAAHPREGLADEAFQREMSHDEAALAAALLAATEAEFGAGTSAPASEAPRRTTCPETSSAPPASPWIGHVLFLVMMAVGAGVASALRGELAIHGGLGAEYSRVVAGGWHAIPVLAIGGALVGFGTRMAGGCTSGHGLSGCGRLVPSSLAATAVFFGVGVAISLALSRWPH